MEIGGNWPVVKKIVNDCLKSSTYCALATVNEDGSPHVTAVGSLILRDDPSGYYLEEFPVKTPSNLKADRRVCILAVRSGRLYWMKSLIKGKFSSSPGIRLMGTAGERREASIEETAAWRRRVKMAKGMKGYDILWKNMKYARDITFDAYEPLRLGAMTRDLKLP